MALIRNTSCQTEGKAVLVPPAHMQLGLLGCLFSSRVMERQGKQREGTFPTSPLVTFNHCFLPDRNVTVENTKAA